ncbi:MAG TPA: S-methyl-5-thioribose-1-phosphate isomerase [Candidatus Limnocylindrales bacterium]|jgi:methylthioribose-1-phosphate isomerase
MPTTEPGRGGGADQADPERRRFFRAFAGEVVRTAAGVVAVATSLQRSSAEAARDLLSPDAIGSMPGATQPVDVSMAVAPSGNGNAIASGPRGFRTPFRFGSESVLLVIDQRRLPEELVENEVRGASDAAFAIQSMVVRGAPAIGQVAALGLALSARAVVTSQPHVRRGILRGAANSLVNARPTAVNLRWAVDRLIARYEAIGELSEDGTAIASAMRDEADRIVFETTTDHGRLADFGLAALPPVEGRPLRILTHCNTGPLACGQFGTALGVVQAAHHAGREVFVFVDETRPYLQGARLTTWELAQAGVPHALIADMAAGHLMARGEVDVVLVGADRVAANGDTANKLGTYTLAVLAARHQIPLLVCAPLSSVDLATADGAGIPIEERSADEVTHLRGTSIAPPGTLAVNPAFDVTPAELIRAIVTEEGTLRAPFGPALSAAYERRTQRWAADRAGPAEPVATLRAAS